MLFHKLSQYTNNTKITQIYSCSLLKSAFCTNMTNLWLHQTGAAVISWPSRKTKEDKAQIRNTKHKKIHYKVWIYSFMCFCQFLFLPFYTLLWSSLISGDLPAAKFKNQKPKWFLRKTNKQVPCILQCIKIPFQQTRISFPSGVPIHRMLNFQFL